MNHRRLVFVAALVALVALTGCLNAITTAADGLDEADGDGAASLEAPETVVSATGGDVSASVDDGPVEEKTSSDSSVAQIEDGDGGAIAGFALDSQRIERHLEEMVNEYRQTPQAGGFGRGELVISGALRAAAGEQSERLARNVLRMYSSRATVGSNVLDDISGAEKRARERRFAEHSAAECNANLNSFDPRREDLSVFTADIPVSGENATAVRYDEVAAHLGPAGGTDEAQVASAVFEVLKSDEDVREGMRMGHFRYLGAGVKNVPSEEVMIVVLDYC